MVVQSLNPCAMGKGDSTKCMLIGSCGPCPLDCNPRYSNQRPCGVPGLTGSLGLPMRYECMAQCRFTPGTPSRCGLSTPSTCAGSEISEPHSSCMMTSNPLA